MKHVNYLFLVALLVVSSAFALIADSLYPELAQSFKLLKKNTGSISYDRQDVLGGVQQIAWVTHNQKKPVVVEILGNDGYTAPYAKAVLLAALANNNIKGVTINNVGSAANNRVIPALTSLGFKSDKDAVKYAEQAETIGFTTGNSNTQAIHILVSDDAASLLSSPDKFAIKLKYTAVTGLTDEQLKEQSKTIATEMLMIAAKFKDNWTN